MRTLRWGVTGWLLIGGAIARPVAEWPAGRAAVPLGGRR